MNRHYQAKTKKILIEQFNQDVSLKDLAAIWKQKTDSSLEDNRLFHEAVQVESELNLVLYFHDCSPIDQSLSLFYEPLEGSFAESEMRLKKLPINYSDPADSKFTCIADLEVKSLLTEAMNETDPDLTFDAKLRWEYLKPIEEADPDKLEVLLLHKFDKVKKHEGFKTIKSFAKKQVEELSKTYGNTIDKFPIALQWIDLLKEVGEGRIEITEDLLKTETSTNFRDENFGRNAEFEPELTDTQESVVNILAPLECAFLTHTNFQEAVNRLCRYFDGMEQETIEPLRIHKGNNKKLGKALGEMHRDLRHKDSIGREYLQFAKDTFDCFEKQDISNEKLNSTNLYKYMTEKR